MKNRILKIISILIILCSCKNELKNESKIELIPNGLKKSVSFKKAKNQNDRLSDFEFEIDTLEVVTTNSINEYFKNIKFFKLNLSYYDSLYIGKRNDTIFTFDQGMDFVEIFLILNKDNISNLGRIGDDFGVRLLKYNDSTLYFHIRELENSKHDHSIYDAPKYPSKTISDIKTDWNGKILDIRIRDKTLKY